MVNFFASQYQHQRTKTLTEFLEEGSDISSLNPKISVEELKAFLGTDDIGKRIIEVDHNNLDDDEVLTVKAYLQKELNIMHE